MKNKKLLIAGASAVSLAALGLGAFAFFADSSEIQEHTYVGTVAVSGSMEMTHTQVKRDRTFEYGIFGVDEVFPFEAPYYPEGMSFIFNNKTATRLSQAPIPRIPNKESVEAAFEVAADNLNPGDNMYIPDWN